MTLKLGVLAIISASLLFGGNSDLNTCKLTQNNVYQNIRIANLQNKMLEPNNKIKEVEKIIHNKALDKKIINISRKIELPPKLIASVIKVESDGTQYARSYTGNMGLMQISWSLARKYGISNPYNEAKNIYAGGKYLKYLIKIYDGNLKKSLVAYNAGPGFEARYGVSGEPKYYAEKVLSYYT